MFERFFPALRGKGKVEHGQAPQMWDVIDRFMREPAFPSMWDEASLAPALDVSETETEVLVRCELPGIDPKDVELSVESVSLTLCGCKKEEKEEKGESFHRKECRYGSFRRTVSLPAEVEPEKAQAKYEKGVLCVTLPKSKRSKSTRITIES